MGQHLIALDWGTSSLRGYLMSSDGDMLDSFTNGQGILHCDGQSFEGVLEKSAGDWMDQYPHAPVVACGMISSRQGWIEAPNLNCPAGLEEFTQHLSDDLMEGRGPGSKGDRLARQFLSMTLEAMGYEPGPPGS